MDSRASMKSAVGIIALLHLVVMSAVAVESNLPASPLIVMLLPQSSRQPECDPHVHAARIALSVPLTEGNKLELVVVNTSDDYAYTGWYQLQLLFSNEATVARTVGILGLQWQPEHAALVHLLARQYHLPHLMLTDKPESGGSRLGVQVAASTDQRAMALVAAVKSFGWERVSILAVHEATDRELLLQVQRQARSSGLQVSVTAEYQAPRDLLESLVDCSVLSYDHQNSLRRKVAEIHRSSTRVVLVLLPEYSRVKTCVVRAMLAEGLAAPAWTWVGLEWPSSAVWQSPAAETHASAVQRAMEGMLRVRLKTSSSVLDPDSFEDRGPEPLVELATAQDGVMHAWDATTCNSSSGEDDADAFRAGVALAHDAARALHGAIASLVQSDPSTWPNSSQVVSRILESQFEGASGHASFYDNGARVPFGLSYEIASLPPGHADFIPVGTVETNKCHGSGDACPLFMVARNKERVHWKNGRWAVPSDRVPETHSSSAHTLLAVELMLVLAICAGVTMHHRKAYWISESLVLTLGGIVLGLFVSAFGSDQVVDALEFDEDLFVLLFLPIIIFESSFSLMKRYFFHQVGKILLLAIAGTLVSAMVVGFGLYGLARGGMVPNMSWAECLAFGSIISAVDPVATLSVFRALKVDPWLNGMVYGESVMNDGVSIVLYKAFASYISEEMSTVNFLKPLGQFVWVLLGSLLLGFLTMCLGSLTLKVLRARNSQVEITLTFLFSYTAFQLAETCQLSGIVSSLTAGFVAKRFMFRNFEGQDAKDFSLQFFAILAGLSESLIFLLLGINIALFNEHFDLAFTVWTILLCLLGRAVNVVPLTELTNWMASRRDPDKEKGSGLPVRVPRAYQVIIWHAGLRGSIAYALALNFPSHHQKMVVECTSSVVLFTIVAMGCTTPLLLKFLDIPMGSSDDPSSTAAQGSQALAPKLTHGRMGRYMNRMDRVLMRMLTIDPLMGIRADAYNLGTDVADSDPGGLMVGKNNFSEHPNEETCSPKDRSSPEIEICELNRSQSVLPVSFAGNNEDATRNSLEYS